MSAIPHSKWPKVAQRYKLGFSMREVAKDFNVSIDAVVYVLRKLTIPRRSMTEANKIVFNAKTPSFTIKTKRTLEQKTLETIGAMLYWAEGYKTELAAGIDFANSNVDMVLLFMRFLRSRYQLDEKRLRPMIYCYSNQDANTLTKFWSNILHIPIEQFTKPYVRTDYREHGRKMEHGLIHIRYNDKKLLLDVLNLIESYKMRYASVG